MKNKWTVLERICPHTHWACMDVMFNVHRAILGCDVDLNQLWSLSIWVALQSYASLPMPSEIDDGHVMKICRLRQRACPR